MPTLRLKGSRTRQKNFRVPVLERKTLREQKLKIADLPEECSYPSIVNFRRPDRRSLYLAQ